QRKSRFGRHARSTLPSLAPWSSRSHRSGNIPLQTVTRPVTSRSILSALAQVGPVHHTSTSTLRSWFRTRASSAGSDCVWREGSAAVTSSMIRTQSRSSGICRQVRSGTQRSWWMVKLDTTCRPRLRAGTAPISTAARVLPPPLRPTQALIGAPIRRPSYARLHASHFRRESLVPGGLDSRTSGCCRRGLAPDHRGFRRPPARTPSDAPACRRCAPDCVLYPPSAATSTATRSRPCSPAHSSQCSPARPRASHHLAFCVTAAPENDEHQGHEPIVDEGVLLPGHLNLRRPF